MGKFEQAKERLDRVNQVIAEYDPVLKERARDILLNALFDGAEHPAPQDDPRGSHLGQRGGLEALLQRWRPRKAADRALLSAYFLIRYQGESVLTSQAINAELKAHGIAVSNITRAIDSNLRTRPPLMVQVKKLGKTRQARKQYEMTRDGIVYVEQRMAD